MGAQGRATLDFGAFPGQSDAFVDVTGQAGYVVTSLVEPWLVPEDTPDHLADEHMVETLKVSAKYLADGSFRIYGVNTSQINEPVTPFKGKTGTIAGGLSAPQGFQQQTSGGMGTRIYGRWTVGWVWN